MPEFVRLKSKATGAEFSVPADIEIGDDVVRLENKPATNSEGVPLPPKYKTSPGASGDEPLDGPPDSDISIVNPARKAATTPKE